MPEVIGDIIPFGVGVALSPVPIIAVLLLVMAPVGARGGVLFLIARVLAFAAMTALFAWASDFIDDAAGSTTPAAVLRLLVGATLVVGAVVKWRRRPHADDEPKLPGWMRSIDGTGPGGAFRLGLVLTVANPKEIAFAAGAGLTIGGAMLGAGEMVLAGAVFVLLACLSVAIPVLAVLVGGERMSPILAEARAWLLRNNAIVMAIVLLVIGAMLIGSGISGLG
jgi:threonine/homoserine/homoserine lactone efflux protein